LLTLFDFLLYIQPSIATQHQSSIIHHRASALYSTLHYLKLIPSNILSKHPFENDHVALLVAPAAGAGPSRSSGSTPPCASLESVNPWKRLFDHLVHGRVYRYWTRHPIRHTLSMQGSPRVRPTRKKPECRSWRASSCRARLRVPQLDTFQSKCRCCAAGINEALSRVAVNHFLCQGPSREGTCIEFPLTHMY
jgi:hypothetical protein